MVLEQLDIHRQKHEHHPKPIKKKKKETQKYQKFKWKT
jgi:hypothetical protein